MPVSKHINFQANETDLERIELLRKYLSDSLAGSHVSNTTVIRNALSIAIAAIIPKKENLKELVDLINRQNPKPF